MNEQELNKLLTEWLKENNAALVVTAFNVYGKRVIVDNLLPENAQPQIEVVKQEAQRAQR